MGGSLPDSITNHMPLADRGACDIIIVVACTLDEAIRRVDRGAIDVRDTVTIIDNLTNDILGTKLRSSFTPEKLVEAICQLRDSLKTRVLPIFRFFYFVYFLSQQLLNKIAYLRHKDGRGKVRNTDGATMVWASVGTLRVY